MYHSFQVLHDLQHHSVVKSIAKVLNQKVARLPKCFLFSQSSSFDRLLQTARLFHDSCCTKQQHCTLSTSPLPLNCHEAVRNSHWSNMVPSIIDAIFKTCMQSISNETIIIQDCWIRIQLCAWRQGKSLASIVDSVFEQSLVNGSSANMHLLRKPMSLAALWQMANLRSSMQLLLEKVT